MWTLQGIELEPEYPRGLSLKGASDKRARPAQGVSYVIFVDMFSGREVPTGLLDVRIEIVLDGSVRRTDRPTVPGTIRWPLVPGQLPYTPDEGLEVLNLPPRQFLRLELSGAFGGKEVAGALFSRRWDRLEFVGTFPKRPIFGLLGSKTYRKTIAQP